MAAKDHHNPDQFKLFNDEGNPTKEASTSVSPENEAKLRSNLQMYGARIESLSRREDWEKAKEVYPHYINTHNALNPDNPIDIHDVFKMFG